MIITKMTIFKCQEGQCNALRRLNGLVVQSSTWKKNITNVTVLTY